MKCSWMDAALPLLVRDNVVIFCDFVFYYMMLFLLERKHWSDLCVQD